MALYLALGMERLVFADPVYVGLVPEPWLMEV